MLRVPPRAWAMRDSMMPPGAWAPFSMAEMTLWRVPARAASSLCEIPAAALAL